ncbi:hypothetical protein F2Q70_00016623 [Brassica cretica]|uniref:Uncharacterized protein n=1 Tax=Brassica cretica TaxID=69181 RepID=A0A8S9I0Q7_BRACR|nr:hypothetical protein F2Q70_00016623 [Brassica cretica]
MVREAIESYITSASESLSIERLEIRSPGLGEDDYAKQHIVMLSHPGPPVWSCIGWERPVGGKEERNNAIW